MSILIEELPSGHRLVEGRFDDIDAMATSPLAWDQEYEQIGRGHFRGHFTQFLMDRLQLCRVRWSPGVLQRGTAPIGTWVFGLPLVAEGSLHVRRRPVRSGELLVATSHDDVGFAATGPTDLMIVALPTLMIDRWVQARRGIERFDVDLPSPRWQVPADELSRRASALSQLLQTLMTQPNLLLPGFAKVERRFSTLSST
jgi:AraC family transcriptional regulator, ethanolamine operon transcriptional activator